MTRPEIEGAIRGLLAHLRIRAQQEIDADRRSESAGDAASQFLVGSELVLFLGTQLMALDDMEETDLSVIRTFGDDEPPPSGKLTN